MHSLAFNWMTPLMRVGAQRFIVQEDLDDLNPGDASGDLGKRLQYYWDKEVATKKKYGFIYLFIGKRQRHSDVHHLTLGPLSGAHYLTRTVVPTHSLRSSKYSRTCSNSLNHSCSGSCLHSSLPTSVIRLIRPFFLDSAGAPHSF